MRTTMAKNETIEHSWYIVDLEGQVLGRAASQIAKVLRGKHKPIYTPHVDTGDFVVVINADKIVLTGRKLKQKTYWRHSGYIGGIRGETAEKLLARQPTELIRRAVQGMLPHNRLGRQQLNKLKIYASAEHPHVAQQPKPLSLS